MSLLTVMGGYLQCSVLRVEFKDSGTNQYHEFCLFSGGAEDEKEDRKKQNKFVLVGRHQRDDATGLRDKEREMEV